MGLKKYLLRDHIAFGVLIGLLTPILMYGVFAIINIVSATDVRPGGIFRFKTVYVLSVFANMLPFRYYMVKLKMDYTGRGIILITLLLAFGYVMMGVPE
jgi:hypothetical protein